MCCIYACMYVCTPTTHTTHRKSRQTAFTENHERHPYYGYNVNNLNHSNHPNSHYIQRVVHSHISFSIYTLYTYIHMAGIDTRRYYVLK
jgi:hypothetical protein